MNAKPLLERVARALAKHKLEAIIFGNAAAALQGAPVTTMDVDFFFRKTPSNVLKLQALARELDATLYKPVYPASKMFRLSNDAEGIQLDFLSQAHGVTSFASLRSRASRVSLGRYEVLVASLEDIIKSKENADRPQDRAVLPILRATLKRKKV